MFKWLQRNKKDRLWKEIRECYQAIETAKNFTVMKCHWCHTPAPNPDANFCPTCGASFHTEPGHPTPSSTTEPLQMAGGERPFQAYRRQLQQQDTADAPTRKFRTVRLDRIV
jgi:hypothetical protein